VEIDYSEPVDDAPEEEAKEPDELPQLNVIVNNTVY
jgi:hypothetical protein